MKLKECFTKVGWDSFSEKCNQNVNYFPAYKYWMGHFGIATGISIVILTALLTWKIILFDILIDFKIAFTISGVIILFYIIKKEVSDYIGDPKWKDGLTDFNQTMVIVPFILFSWHLWIWFAIVLVLQILFFYVTVIMGWTHE